jgi:hypothetical protein
MQPRHATKNVQIGKLFRILQLQKKRWGRSNAKVNGKSEPAD